jgi:HSP20 family molecular chaperone IbpA
MRERDPTTWMWAEACHMIEEAERLQRQFFRLGESGARAAWEPPVDVYEDEAQFEILVALPGVASDRTEVVVDGDVLVVRARREIPAETRGCVIQRLEIPHGYFERRIQLPRMRLELQQPRFVNGVLVLNLRKPAARA